MPHNATQTTRESLRAAGVVFSFDHFSDIFTRRLRQWLINGIHCVVPMRHPMKVFKTHKWMGTDFDQVLPYYLNLIYVVHPFRPLYLPVDSPERERCLDRIDFVLGIELDRSLPVVGQSGRWLETEFTRKEEARVVDFMREFEDVFTPLGYTHSHVPR